ncbi:hypothetical protein EVAR_80010_1 [Eumeta japonica]|uniref:Uncharacterized protein n=1 Tax=Eumeta variegata TaxID=151549 RepID=A0A4C1WKD9_EUMVA|nr:hypothetical protein EVAR_80010_1 [Eumeta japonica]
MDPGSPSLLWPMRLTKPAVASTASEEQKPSEDRAQSPSLAERLASAPASPSSLSSPSSPAPPSLAVPAPPSHQFQAALVAEKYLLLEQVEGSSLCRCVDVRTQEEYVCKLNGCAGAACVCSDETAVWVSIVKARLERDGSLVRTRQGRVKQHFRC